MILNEFIKSTFDMMKQIYVDLFNRILNEGQIPESWTIRIIVSNIKIRRIRKILMTTRA